MKNEFTKWNIEKTDNKGESFIMDEKYGIATVYGGIGEQSIKNAKLIAAAPEMFKALYDVAEMLEEKKQKGRKMSKLEWEIYKTSWDAIQKAIV